MTSYQIYFLFFTIQIVASVIVGSHAVLYKKDPRASVYWVLLILFVPWLGILFYFLFGINRIRREAKSLQEEQQEIAAAHSAIDGLNATTIKIRAINGDLSLRKGHGLKIFTGGDAAYPSMMQAIEAARKEVLLSTYIFDNDAVGKQFVEVLQRAVERGVFVRVLVDGIGVYYSFPKITSLLKKAKIPYAIFLPTLSPFSTRFLNLRNHRKLLIVDRKLAFTGGMNIRAHLCVSNDPSRAIKDTHFVFYGEVVADLVKQYRDDWFFATKKVLPRWSCPENELDDPKDSKPFLLVLPDGPNLPSSNLAALMMIRLSGAKKNIRIVSPYFLPDQILIAFLTTAAMRGVEVDIVVPKNNNLVWMNWAMQAQAWQLLDYGIRIWQQDGPFDHSKLFTMDDERFVVGSSNWDPRSFRLNFELNIEGLCTEFTQHINSLIQTKIQNSQPLTLEQLDKRSLPVKLRDGFVKLFQPIL